MNNPEKNRFNMHHFFQAHRSKSIKLTRLYINRSPTPVNKLSQMSAFQVARLMTSREISCVLYFVSSGPPPFRCVKSPPRDRYILRRNPVSPGP